MVTTVIPFAVSVLAVACLFSARDARTMRLTIALLSLVSTALADQPTRDFYRYDLGGTIEIDSRGKQAVLRSFLWRHWIKHKRGIIVTVVHSVDAGDSTVSYFVEPNAPGGDWRIVIEARRNPHPDPDPTIQRSVVYDVKRIKPPDNGWGTRVEIPNDAVRGPESYMLSLRDQQGKLLEEL